MSAQLPLKRYMSLDLHGSSVKNAKALVDKTIKESREKQVDELTVITGRGNHVNRNGTRAVLFNVFPTWLKANATAATIKKVEKNRLGFLERLS